MLGGGRGWWGSGSGAFSVSATCIVLLVIDRRPMMSLAHLDYSPIRLHLSLGHRNRRLQTRHVTPLNRRAEWLRSEQYLGLLSR